MVAVTFGVAIDVVQTAMSGGNMVDGGLVSGFQLILGFCTLLVYLVMRHFNKHLNSPTVDAEILGWKLDIWYS
ncbi:cation diffusion facilitator family transporter, partial [gut metagenome]